PSLVNLISLLHLTPPSFFFNPTPTTETYTLSLHDALPISSATAYAQESAEVMTQTQTQGFTESFVSTPGVEATVEGQVTIVLDGDRKSTRLNSSHVKISYAVFCLKKKKKKKKKKK